jgi:flagellar hook-associated protein 1 FlgK
MSNLFGIMDMAGSALQAQEQSLEASGNNIANVNTPGYSRQVVVLQELPGTDPASGIGGGVEVAQVQSVQDSVLEIQLNQENQNQAQLTSYLSGAQQAQTQFNDTAGSGLQGVLSGFFSSLQQLSTNPSDSPTRQSVLLAAQNLAQGFNSTSQSLTSEQSSLNSSITNDVSQVNVLTKQIAALNVQVQQLQSGNQNSGAVIDQRTEAIRNLSSLIGVSVTDAGNGAVSVSTANGAALVVGNTAETLTTQANAGDGQQHIYDQGQDLTSSIQGGSIGGTLQVRDQTIPGLLQSLDQLAAGIETAVNTQNKAGTDLNGKPGGNIFTPPPAGVAGAAAAMSVAITDPSLIAASNDGSAGSNGNITAMAALGNQGIVNGQTPANAYTNMVSTLGGQISNATSEQSASNLNLTQLQSQRASISGVSMDEEASNLIQFERAYSAAARVSEVADQMTQTALGMGTATS